MRVPKSDDVRFLSITRPFQEDEPLPEWSPPVSQVLVFIVAFALVALALVWVAAVLG